MKDFEEEKARLLQEFGPVFAELRERFAKEREADPYFQATRKVQEAVKQRGSAVGFVVYYHYCYRLKTNHFYVVVRETAHHVFLRAIGSIRTSVTGGYGDEVPNEVRPEDLVPVREGEKLLKAKKVIGSDGTLSFCGRPLGISTETLELYSGIPLTFDLMD